MLDRDVRDERELKSAFSRRTITSANQADNLTRIIHNS